MGERRQSWFVYVLLSVRGRTYVGISREPERRLSQHNGQRRGGARATRAGRPWSLEAVHGPYRTRGRALRVEARLKQLRGRRRLAWQGD